MDFLKNLEDNSILIIPPTLKVKVLEYINDANLLINIKLMTFNDLKKGLLFDYNNQTIYETMQHLNVSYGVAKDYINNLYYIEDKKYEESKLVFLQDLKDYLEKKNLLIKDPLFKNLLREKKNIYVYGFDYLTKFNNYLLSMLDQNKVEVILKEKKDYQHEIHEFKNIFAEVAYICENIAKMIDSGISPSKIYLANYSSEYNFAFTILSKQYNLPISLANDSNVYDTVIGSYFLKHLSNNRDLLLYKMKKQFAYETNEKNAEVINKIANLLNSYYWCDNILEVKDLIENEMRHIKLNKIHYEEEISLVNILDNVFFDDEYVFLMGFNLGAIPHIKKDEDYISDAIKPVFLETTEEQNKVAKESLITALKNIKNITITYKLNSPFTKYEKSFLANDKMFTIVKEKDFISRYSNSYNELIKTRYLDDLIKFNNKHEDLDILYHSYEDNYKTFDNKFTGIDKQVIKDYLDDKFVFSYSNISTYYKCPFRFYVSSILKINNYEETIEQFIGTLFHKVLEKCLESDLDIDQVYDECIQENKGNLVITSKERFFLTNLKKEIHFVIETIREQYKHSKHTESLAEKEIKFDIERKIKTKIKGFVDKILVLNNSLLIVDYKTTNSQKIDVDLLEFGLSIQLPIYLYLLKCVDANYEVAGIYIQHILDLNNEYEPNKDALLEKKKKLQLEGITFNDIHLISNFDDTYDKSEVIKSLSTKDGEIKKNKSIMSLEERDDLIKLMENLIMNCIDNVSDANFAIHPINIVSKANGCDYCTYKDICYRKYKDINYQQIAKKGGNEDE